MSTPPGREEPHGGPPVEPVRVIRPRRTDALAELMREFRRENGQDATEELPQVPAAAPAAPRSAAGEPWTSRSGGRRGTHPVPPSLSPASPSPSPSSPSSADVPGRGLRRAAVALAVAAAALGGFGGALLLPGRGEASTAAQAGARQPSATASAAPDPASTPAPAPAPTSSGTGDPDGPGTLREGDSGPEVAELQRRLLNVPDVYRGGSTDGRYDAALREAVARYQLWYGVSGDETGVYGNDTRRSLESRTTTGSARYGG